MAYWMQKARKRMEKKGSVGSFGKATPEKIRKGLRKGGKMAKKAAFAKAARTIARNRKKKRSR